MKNRKKKCQEKEVHQKNMAMDRQKNMLKYLS